MNAWTERNGESGGDQLPGQEAARQFGEDFLALHVGPDDDLAKLDPASDPEVSDAHSSKSGQVPAQRGFPYWSGRLVRRSSIALIARL